MPLLDVQNLTVEYYTEEGTLRAVEDLSFTLEREQSLGLVGESGCGKTTAMLALMRLVPQAARIVDGRVVLDGVDLMQLSAKDLRKYRWNHISMVFQSAMNALNPTRTIKSQIAEAMQVHGSVPRQEMAEEVVRLLELVGISSQRATEYPHQYSGGMRQRAMLAMALACRPDILIADEPTTALDVMTQAHILELLRNLQQEFGISIIIVSHDLGVVAELCDDVLVMYAGWSAEYASADAIFNEARHPYTQKLLSAYPEIEDPGNGLTSIPGSPPSLAHPPPGCRYEPRCHLAVERCAEIVPSHFALSPSHMVRCIRAEEGEI